MCKVAIVERSFGIKPQLASTEISHTYFHNYIVSIVDIMYIKAMMP